MKITTNLAANNNINFTSKVVNHRGKEFVKLDPFSGSYINIGENLGNSQTTIKLKEGFSPYHAATKTTRVLVKNPLFGESEAFIVFENPTRRSNLAPELEKVITENNVQKLENQALRSSILNKIKERVMTKESVNPMNILYEMFNEAKTKNANLYFTETRVNDFKKIASDLTEYIIRHAYKG